MKTKIYTTICYTMLYNYGKTGNTRESSRTIMET